MLAYKVLKDIIDKHECYLFTKVFPKEICRFVDENDLDESDGALCFNLLNSVVEGYLLKKSKAFKKCKKKLTD